MSRGNYDHNDANDRADASAALKWLDSGRMGRAEWLAIAASARAAGLSFAEFLEWSERGDNFGGRKDAERAWNDQPDDPITPGLLFRHALDAGWTWPERDADDRRGGRRNDSARVAVRGTAAGMDRRPMPDKEAADKKAHDRTRALEWLRALLAAASPARDTHPYLHRKGVNGDSLLEIPLSQAVRILGYTPETRRGALAGDTLLIAPLHAGDGVPASLELIDGEGRKYALPGLERKGLMWGPARLDDPPLIGIAEGVATGKTVAAARPCPTFAAGSIHNIGPALDVLRGRYPSSDFVIFADLGKKTREADEGVLRLGAEHFVPVVAPNPAQMGEGDTDFNDMERAAGFDAVSEWIENHCRSANEIDWLATDKPIEIDYVLPSLPLGTVGMIAGEGAIGKTFIALDLCASVALGRSVSGIEGRFAKLVPGRTAIVLGEDPRDIVHNRMYAMRQVHQYDAADIRTLSQRMKVLSMVGEDMRVVAVDNTIVSEGPFCARLRALCTGRRLVILDPLIRTHDGPENDNNVANKLMLKIQRVALETRCCILLLHHFGKGKDRGESWQDARGASAYTTSVRWQMNVLLPSAKEVETYGLDKRGLKPRQFVRCVGVKANYDDDAGDFWLRRGFGGVLVHASMDLLAAAVTDAFDEGAPRFNEPSGFKQRPQRPPHYVPGGE